MQVDPGALPRHLEGGLAPVYLVFGEETLLVEEAADAIRAAARRAGSDERLIHHVEAGFDWSILTHEALSGSLFAQRRLVELRLPSGRPGDKKGSQELEAWAASPPADTTLLVLCGKLERSARDSAWFKALDRVGVSVACWPVDEASLPGWISARMKSRGLSPAAGVIDELSWYLAGNLLAAAQEVDKLTLLCSDGNVDLETARASLADSARYDVYALTDACLGAEPERVLRVLAALRAEGVEPALVLWALAREVHGMQQVSADLAAGKPQGQVFKARRIWSQRAPRVAAAMRRLGPRHWAALVARLARLDRVMRGRETGDIWLELERFSLRLAGLPVL